MCNRAVLLPSGRARSATLPPCWKASLSRIPVETTHSAFSTRPDVSATRPSIIAALSEMNIAIDVARAQICGAMRIDGRGDGALPSSGEFFSFSASPNACNRARQSIASAFCSCV
jgi:hypothetical protein